MIVISIIAEIFCKILVLIGEGVVLFVKGLVWIFGGWIKEAYDKKQDTE